MRLIRKLSVADNRKRKAEVIVSATLAMILIITVPVFAWFNYQRRIAKLAKIKAPDDLYINAAHREDKVQLDMRTINVAQTYMDGSIQKSVKSQGFVFSVSGNYVSRYTLQFEHTTNNPYTYTIYEGEIYKDCGSGGIRSVTTGNLIGTDHPNWQTRNSDGSFKYVEYTATGIFDSVELAKVDFTGGNNPDISTVPAVVAGDKLYVYIGNEVTGSYINKTAGERYADSTLTTKSYDQYPYFNKYADPVFWQKQFIPSGANKGKPFYNTYVIKVSWENVNDITQYDKETDIIYISAFVE